MTKRRNFRRCFNQLTSIVFPFLGDTSSENSVANSISSTHKNSRLRTTTLVPRQIGFLHKSSDLSFTNFKQASGDNSLFSSNSSIYSVEYKNNNMDTSVHQTQEEDRDGSRGNVDQTHDVKTGNIPSGSGLATSPHADTSVKVEPIII